MIRIYRHTHGQAFDHTAYAVRMTSAEEAYLQSVTDGIHLST